MPWIMPHAALGFVTCGLSAGFQRCRTNLGSECGALRLGLATEQEQYVFLVFGPINHNERQCFPV